MGISLLFPFPRSPPGSFDSPFSSPSSDAILLHLGFLCTGAALFCAGAATTAAFTLMMGLSQRAKEGMQVRQGFNQYPEYFNIINYFDQACLVTRRITIINVFKNILFPGQKPNFFPLNCLAKRNWKNQYNTKYFLSFVVLLAIKLFNSNLNFFPQGTHYTLLATFEVLGKLSFASVSGWAVDEWGIRAAFAGIVRRLIDHLKFKI